MVGLAKAASTNALDGFTGLSAERVALEWDVLELEQQRGILRLLVHEVRLLPVGRGKAWRTGAVRLVWPEEAPQP